MRRGKEVWSGKKRWVWIIGDSWAMLDTRSSGENGGDRVLMDHEPEDGGEREAEFFGEVRGERLNQGAGVVGEVGRQW